MTLNNLLGQARTAHAHGRQSPAGAPRIPPRRGGLILLAVTLCACDVLAAFAASAASTQPTTAAATTAAPAQPSSAPARPAHAQSASAPGPLGYYRYPTLHGDTVVFVAEGDLWSVAIDGGLARRLTTHLEVEDHPAISPDGKLLAFTASYEGPAEVYTMPLAGGLPTRRTYTGEWARVEGWTPDGRLLYATAHYATLPSTQLAALDLATGRSELLPLAQASEGVYEPTGRTLFFTRFAQQWSHTKGYQGGTAQNLWRFTAGDPEAVPLTADYPGTSRHPMWWEERLYFASDRDGTMNLWSMAPDGSDLRQQTRHAGWDVKSPSLDQGRIAYQLGADLRVYDIAADQDLPLAIGLASDFEQARERWIEKPMEHLSTAHISPDGTRLALTAYGQVFVAPVKQGRLAEITRTSGVRYRSARFAPDGQSLLVLSDESGEVEWWRFSPTGTAPPEQLSADGTVVRFDGRPSPDGRWIAYTDHDQRLWLFDTNKRRSMMVAESPQWGLGNIAWSPDSRWLAYGLDAPNGLRRILIHDLETQRSTPVTSDRYHSWDPQWSPDGHWLYFLSDRTFVSRVGGPWGARQPEPCFSEQTRLYLLPLEPGLRSPFAPADELHPGEDPRGAERDHDARRGRDAQHDRSSQRVGSAERDRDPGLDGRGKVDRERAQAGPEAKPPEVRIDFTGIIERLLVVPAPAGNYDALALNGERLFWIARSGDAEGNASLQALEITPEALEPVTILADIHGYELAGNGEKLLVRKEDNFYVFSADSDPAPDLEKARIDLTGWAFPIDPREKWRQMFIESWRLERDYFYDPQMHGLDWPAVLNRYLPLVERVTDRAELADLQAQMASELGALHTYVWGGDFRTDPLRIETASLGAVLAREPAAGGYRIVHIYRADPDEPEQRAPLAEPAAGIAPGDIITAINGVSLLEVADPGLLLRAQGDRQVRLAIQRRDGRDKPYDVIVTPIAPDRARDLRYDEWEYTRREMTDSLSAGEIGYVHLRAMGGDDIAQWYRDYYPVFDRRGLIVDVRHNNGGNIDSWVLGKLLRRAWMYWQPRTGAPYWNMQYAFRGHMVVLVDAWTMSDGEAFAEGFRRLGLGQVIGTRTWGGEIWLSSSNRLVDDGIVTAAEFGVYGPEGQWLIEGHGVDPDLVVDNLPHATFRGDDAQLRAAVAHLQALIREDSRDVPPAPAYPRRGPGR